MTEDPRQCWRTDPRLFADLHAEFEFTVDAAASPHNALLPRFWTAADNALNRRWRHERVFVNPPFRLASEFVRHAIIESSSGRCSAIVMLLLAKTCGQAIAAAVDDASASIRVFPRRPQYLTPSGRVHTRNGRVQSFDRDSMLLVFDGDRSLSTHAGRIRTASEMAKEYGVEHD